MTWVRIISISLKFDTIHFSHPASLRLCTNYYIQLCFSIELLQDYYVRIISLYQALFTFVRCFFQAKSVATEKAASIDKIKSFASKIG